MNYHLYDNHITIDFNSYNELILFKENFSCEDINSIIINNTTIILKNNLNTNFDDDLLRSVIEKLDFIEELF